MQKSKVAPALLVATLTLPVHQWPAWADDRSDALAAAAIAGEVANKQRMRRLFPDAVTGIQATAPVVPQLEIDADPSGQIATYQPNGTTQTANSAFFQSLGTNGRTCFTCHEPQDGWSLSAQHAQQRFSADPTDPLFRLVGANEHSPSA